jgi:hypothetical protein
MKKKKKKQQIDLTLYYLLWYVDRLINREFSDKK